MWAITFLVRPLSHQESSDLVIGGDMAGHERVDPPASPENQIYDSC
jgi:hypothetical protein